MPKSAKGKTPLYVAVAVILIAAIVGASLVVVHANSAGLALFELITFSVGIAALLLAVLGSVSASYQMRMTRRIAKEIHTAIGELKDIDRTNEAIRRRLNQDYELAKDVAEALQEAGIIEDDDERHAVASTIEQKVRIRARQDKS